jgi:LysR family transcriptional regulator, low CO2-responsive transcriptional regulator
MDRPTLAELKAFDATARAGGMSAAARAIGLTQPTLSAHILALERRFGVELFLRRGRMLELTEFGRLLQETTHRIWRAEEAAAELLLDARSQFQGRLSLVAVGPYNVTPMLVRYRARWPNVRIAVGVGDSREIVERVLDQRGDLGVLVHPVADPRIHCVPYRRQRLVLLVPRAHPLARRRTVRLAELQGLEFVMREEGSTTRLVFERALQAADVRVRVALEMGSREAVREAVAQGLGLGIVAATAHVPDPRLLTVDLEAPALYTHPHVICLEERRRAPLIRNFLSVVDALRVDGPSGTEAGGTPA